MVLGSHVDSVRLLNGTNWCSGRLEVNLNQSWSSVGEDAFDQQDAEVVCRELGCGPPTVLQGALFGEPEAPTWSKEFQCEGNEAALLDCDGSDGNDSGNESIKRICSDLLVEPQISPSSSTVGVSKAIKQGSEVPIGSDFSIMCSTKPQYQGSSFQLIFIISNSTQNSTADPAHQGTYSCVYHVSVYSHNFWSRSQPLSLTVSGSLTDLIIRPVVVLLGLVGSVLLYIYFKTSSSQKSGPERKRCVDGSRAAERRRQPS
uniref:SRCR domain-containing protein n=2 Tax=Nothobranchius kuhntae TaxID=321403 RepID=A0A1A8HNV2_NOTKU